MSQSFRFYPGEYRIRPARDNWELNACTALRRAVFCREQEIFEDDDADAIDTDALHIAALSYMFAQPEQVVGTVRIHEVEPDTWMGSRLAVHRDYRSEHALGHKLIQHAVQLARARGCKQFLAHVQWKNIALFQRLHWQTIAPINIYGLPHFLMQADLNFYLPAPSDEMTLLSMTHAAKLHPVPALEAA